jgi:hypothetical protein
MDVGSIAFNVPPLKLHEAVTVILLLSPKQSMEELQKQLREEGGVGDIKSARIKIHDKMQAVLLGGDDFDITNVTPDIVDISKQEPTQWRWGVRPLRAGTLQLHITLNAIVDLDDGSGPRLHTIRTYSYTYVVQVPWGEGRVATFFKNNWPWLWATLLAAVGFLIWNRNRTKRPVRRVYSAEQGPGIFISYRREDTAGHTGRLHDDLASHFGAERVFKDIDSIAYGDNFVTAIKNAVSSSAVLIVVIGRKWLSITDENGNRRLDNPLDFVRLEIATALTLRVRIIPALVEGASPPSEGDLPEPLAELALCHAIDLSDTRWNFDVERLIEALEEEMAKFPTRAPPQVPG